MISVKHLRLCFLICLFLFSSSRALAQNVPVINEFLPSPEKGNPEWIEFYNPTDYPIDLQNYWLDDDNNLIQEGIIQKGSKDPGSDPKQLQGSISSKSFFILELSGYLNNDGDSPSLFSLINGQENLVNSYTYNKNPGTNVSFGRQQDGADAWISFTAPTKGTSNNTAIIQISPQNNQENNSQSAPVDSSNSQNIVSIPLENPPPRPAESNLIQSNLKTENGLKENQIPKITSTAASQIKSLPKKIKKESSPTASFAAFTQVLGASLSPQLQTSPSVSANYSQLPLKNIFLGTGILILIAAGWFILKNKN